jgi:hypothetical protein
MSFQEAEKLERQRRHGISQRELLPIAFAGRSNGFALLDSMKSVFEQPNGQRSNNLPSAEDDRA